MLSKSGQLMLSCTVLLL